MTPKPFSPLRNFRRARTLSQQDMAHLLGVSQQNYSRYESGLVEPPPDIKARIAAILGESPGDVFPHKESA